MVALMVAHLGQMKVDKLECDLVALWEMKMAEQMDNCLVDQKAALWDILRVEWKECHLVVMWA